MTAEEIRSLPIDQKMQLMEALWQDLRDRFDQTEISEEHKLLLDHRRARADQGAARVLDWDLAKRTL